MNLNFESVPESVTKFANDILHKNFPELSDAKIIILYDVSGKKHSWLAKIYKANDMLRFFTCDDLSGESADYIIVVDKVFYDSEVITDLDRMRLFRHEFRHIYYDPEKKTRNAQYKLCKHNVNTFYEEIELNTADGEPRWEEKMSAIYMDYLEKKKMNNENI